MRAEVVCIGTELLIGSIVNTNEQYLACELAGLGLDLYRMTTVGDNPSRIASAVWEALSSSDLVIITGGLGPTVDDVTLKTVSGLFQIPLKEHRPTYQRISKRLKERRLSMTRDIARQALAPEGSVVLPNLVGTAPGIWLPVSLPQGPRHLLLLPGPPAELQAVFHHARRLIAKRLVKGPSDFLIERILFPNCIESEIAEKIKDLLNLRPPVTVGIYARAGEVEITLMAKGGMAGHNTRRVLKTRQLQRKMKSIIQVIERRFPKKLLLKGVASIEEAVHRELLRGRRNLAVAESCTGGLLAEALTRYPGSSKYFIGAEVVYHNRTKIQRLGIPKAILQRYGAVSRRVARAMAEGVRRLLSTTVGIAITGIAGPSGSSVKKPVGLVYIAVAGPDSSQVFRYHFLGNRERIRLKATKAALFHLLKAIRRRT